MTDLSDAELGLLEPSGPGPSDSTKVIDGTVYEHVSLEVSYAPRLETVAPGITGEAPRMFVGSVAFTNRTEHAELSPTKRTRWLAFLNDRGRLVYAPAVRTFQLALVAGMGQEWYWKAMAFSADPPFASHEPRDRAMLIGATETPARAGNP